MLAFGANRSGKALRQAWRIGSDSSKAYRVTLPVYASTTAFTELRM